MRLAISSGGIVDRDVLRLTGALRSIELQRDVLGQLSDRARREDGPDETIDALLARVEAGELVPAPGQLRDPAVDEDADSAACAELVAAIERGDSAAAAGVAAAATTEPGWTETSDRALGLLEAREAWPEMFELVKSAGYRTLNGFARLSYARALAAMGQADAAIEVLGHEIAGGFAAHAALRQRARLLLDIGRRAAARRDVNQLVIEDPTDASVLELAAELDRARVTERQAIPREVKDRVWQRDRGRCAECGSQELLEFDHVIPLAMGGSNSERNLQLLCERCNRDKAAAL